ERRAARETARRHGHRAAIDAHRAAREAARFDLLLPAGEMHAERGPEHKLGAAREGCTDVGAARADYLGTAANDGSARAAARLHHLRAGEDGHPAGVTEVELRTAGNDRAEVGAGGGGAQRDQFGAAAVENGAETHALSNVEDTAAADDGVDGLGVGRNLLAAAAADDGAARDAAVDALPSAAQDSCADAQARIELG